LREKLAAVLIIPSLGVPNGLVIYINTAPQSFLAERDARVIAKEKIDPPCSGASLEGEAAITTAPREEPPAATSPTDTSPTYP
jgi:hypothetical protein